MSYTPTNWQTGDTVTAEKLNKMESGIENANDVFVVTLTPTAEDFSGVMDKTVGEINEAYQAGRRIVFRVVLGQGAYMDVDCTARYFPGLPYPSFNAYIVTEVDRPFPIAGIVYAATGSTDFANKDTYSVFFYPLTPMT